jgi:hypothetical protein
MWSAARYADCERHSEARRATRGAVVRHSRSAPGRLKPAGGITGMTEHRRSRRCGPDGCNPFSHLHRPFGSRRFDHQEERSRILGDVGHVASRAAVIHGNRQMPAADRAVDRDAQRVGRRRAAHLPRHAQQPRIADERLGLLRSPARPRAEWTPDSDLFRGRRRAGARRQQDGGADERQRPRSG